MRQWQAVHVPDRDRFESNGVGELRLVSIAQWAGWCEPFNPLSAGAIESGARSALRAVAKALNISSTE